MKRVSLTCFSLLTVMGCNYDFGSIEEEESDQNETQTHEPTASDSATNDDTQVDTGTVSDTGSGSDSETQEDTTTGESIVLYLHFWERIRQLNYYQGHELHMGPGDSTDPTKPGWTVLADEESMYNAAANDVWSTSIPIAVSGKSGSSVRFAWRYTGLFADDWYIDDICLSTMDSLPSQAQCHYWQDFDGVNAGAWPSGFTTAAGPNNDADSNWSTTTVIRHSSPNGASITYSYTAHTDRFLISPAIVLP